MNQRAHGSRVGRDRVWEMLAILQLGLCGRCGRARYTTRRTARHAARIAAPGTRLRAYRCGDAWHLTSPPGRPQFIAPPVTMAQQRTPFWGSLDQQGRGERRYRRSAPNGHARPQGDACTPRGGSGSDRLEDTRDTRAPARRAQQQPDGRRRAARPAGGAW